MEKEIWTFHGHVLPDILLLIPNQFCKGECLIWMDKYVNEQFLVIDGDMMPFNYYPDGDKLGKHFHNYNPKIGCPSCKSVLFDYKDAEYKSNKYGITYSLGDKIPNYNSETMILTCPNCGWSQKVGHFSYPGA